MIKIEIYKSENGKESFTVWKEGLDIQAQVRIDARLTRIRETGNFGNCEPVGNGVFELILILVMAIAYILDMRMISFCCCF